MFPRRIVYAGSSKDSHLIGASAAKSTSEPNIGETLEQVDANSAAIWPGEPV
jgi:hypothetical protein